MNEEQWKRNIFKKFSVHPKHVEYILKFVNQYELKDSSEDYILYHYKKMGYKVMQSKHMSHIVKRDGYRKDFPFCGLFLDFVNSDQTGKPDFFVWKNSGDRNFFCVEGKSNEDFLKPSQVEWINSNTYIKTVVFHTVNNNEATKKNIDYMDFLEPNSYWLQPNQSLQLNPHGNECFKPEEGEIEYTPIDRRYDHEWFVMPAFGQRSFPNSWYSLVFYPKHEPYRINIELE